MASIRWTAKAVRKQYISFFENANHVNWKSSAVIPHNDATLLFINAGMNQFKPLLLGTADAQSDLGKLKRAVNTQKCIRAGGKHNDLEDVGKDVYHHTFFEMLGNWSFGDYFKAYAIDYAWTLLVDVYQIDPERLYVTYFGGDSSLPNCPHDEEAKQCWLKYLPEWKVLPFGAKDNFWEMADVGPCGPCSEIHYDRIGGRDASAYVNADDPNVLEIWNLVFMQFNRESGGLLSPLPAPCVDTGMGFERVTSVLQGVSSNYDTDIFTPIFDRIKDVLNVPVAYSGKVGAEDVNRMDMSYRVLSDHIRCLAVAIADGAEPSNEGRGYVLRRILRRALRYGKQYLGAPDSPWFHKLVDAVIWTLGDVFPELEVHCERVKNVLVEEETLFSKALSKGVELFKKSAARVTDTVFPGLEAFTLYTTYGFPLDLVELMATEIGLTVDVEEFNRLFSEHQLISENKNFVESAKFYFGTEQIHELKNTFHSPGTKDHYKYVWNTVGDEPPFHANVVAIWDGKQFLDVLTTEETVALILDKSNFYAEQGGQIYDTGVAKGFYDGEFAIQNVQKYENFVVHIGALSSGALKKGESVSLHLDNRRRFFIAQNHTATHLLNFALRKVLGGTCDQRGSLVEPNRLRFDFQWNKQLEDSQLADVIGFTQDLIGANLAVYTKEVSTQFGKSIVGLRAIFGENYPDPVRVVSIGIDMDTVIETPDAGYGFNFSIEFCGGTHVKQSSDIQAFVIVSEESVSKGVRRVVALSGEAAKNALQEYQILKEEVASLKRLDHSNPSFASALSDMRMKLDESKSLPIVGKRKLLKQLDSLSKIQLEHGKLLVKELLKEARERGKQKGNEYKDKEGFGVILNLEQFKGDGKIVDAAVIAFSEVAASIPLMIVSGSSGKGTSVITVVPPEWHSVLNAQQWMNEALQPINGKGGGTPARAVGASRGSENIAEAIEAAKQYLTAAGLQTNI